MNDPHSPIDQSPRPGTPRTDTSYQHPSRADNPPSARAVNITRPAIFAFEGVRNAPSILQPSSNEVEQTTTAPAPDNEAIPNNTRPIRRHNRTKPARSRDILDKYIALIHNNPKWYNESSASREYEGVLSEVFSDEALDVLQRHGHSVIDILNWAWILEASTAARAASRFMILANADPTSSLLVESVTKPLPHFVFYRLLKRPSFPPHALETLISYLEKLQSKRRSVKWSKPSLDSIQRATFTTIEKWDQLSVKPVSSEPIDDGILFNIFGRLLKLARKSLPSAILKITTLAFPTLETSRNDAVAMVPSDDPRSVQRLTEWHNHALTMLADRVAANPFEHAHINQDAQFYLLRRMTEMKPPIVVDREGHRAIVRVQLAHRKTPQEQQWAIFKARSWPPWKQEKLGIDADRGNEGRRSRATEALDWMTQAGYTRQDWDSAAQIVSGWDTDRSPTIQTRTWERRPPADYHLKPARSDQSSQSSPRIWAARIKATRTLNEAWAGFLACEEEGRHLTPHVYNEMLQKIILSTKGDRQKHTDDEYTSKKASSILPGDGENVWPEPTNPFETTYVRTPPPSVKEFLGRFKSEEISVSPSSLDLLVRTASSLKDGLEYLRTYGNLSSSSMHVLDTAVKSSGNDLYDQRAMDSIPAPVLSAFLQLLCKYPFGKTSNSKLRWMHVISAFQLIQARSNAHRSVWRDFLWALSLAHGRLLHGNRTAPVHAVLLWRLTERAVEEMDKAQVHLDFGFLACILVNYHRAVWSERWLLKHNITTLPAITEALPTLVPVPSLFSSTATLEQGLSVLKRRFDGIVGKKAAAFLPNGELNQPYDVKNPPSPHALPKPSELHIMIRALGASRDRKGLLSLARWMRHHHVRLRSFVDTQVRGERLFRICIIALRAVLDPGWILIGDDATEENALSITEETKSTMDELVEIVDSVGHWGGWPTDEDVDQYFKAPRPVDYWI